MGYSPPHPHFIYSRPPPFEVEGGEAPFQTPFIGGYIRGITLIGWVLGGKKNLGVGG
jgi:hypothetical protein